jgi:hypothetical protein
VGSGLALPELAHLGTQAFHLGMQLAVLGDPPAVAPDGDFVQLGEDLAGQAL